MDGVAIHMTNNVVRVFTHFCLKGGYTTLVFSHVLYVSNKYIEILTFESFVTIGAHVCEQRTVNCVFMFNMFAVQQNSVCFLEDEIISDEILSQDD